MNPAYKIKDLVPDGSQWREVIDAKEIQAARVILKAAQIARDKTDRRMHDNLSINCVDMKKSVCYLLGIIDGLDLILELPTEVKRLQDEIESKTK